MQNTRINNLFDSIGRSLGLWFFNPWRRFSLLALSFFFGFFLGSAVATTAGQTAEWDILTAGILLVVTEFASRSFYSRTQTQRRSLWGESLYLLKVGLTYSLFLEAFKLGS